MGSLERRLQFNDIEDGHRGIEGLLVFGLVVNFPHHIHTLYHLAKGGITLFVRIVLTAKIKTGLIADANKKLAGGGAGLQTRQRYGAVFM